LVTGHSLGAALALLCAADLKRSGVVGSGIKLYDYGSPRVGNRAFANYMYNLLGSGAVMRVVHAKDAVPHLPP
jgi:predicted lipase